MSSDEAVDSGANTSRRIRSMWAKSDLELTCLTGTSGARRGARSRTRAVSSGSSSSWRAPSSTSAATTPGGVADGPTSQRNPSTDRSRNHIRTPPTRGATYAGRDVVPEPDAGREVRPWVRRRTVDEDDLRASVTLHGRCQLLVGICILGGETPVHPDIFTALADPGRLVR